MVLLPLFTGILLGIAALLAFVFGFPQRDANKIWRGYLNAICAGIVLGALFDLLPQALEIASVIVATFFQTQLLTPFDLPRDSFLGIGAGVVAEAVVPLGALLILFLFLSASSAPITARGQNVGLTKMGWRAYFRIPVAGQTDWQGAALIAFGLGVHNLWLGQVRGALAANNSSAVAAFLFAFGLGAALRAFAVVGPLVDARKGWLALLGGAALIGGAGALGALVPETGKSLALGIVPPLLAVLLLPLALGRLLRIIQSDIGLGWQTTMMLLATLGIERLCGYLLLMIAQGQL